MRTIKALGILVLLCLAMLSVFSTSSLALIPDWVERYHQRRTLAKRVQLAGGWDAIRRECLTLAEQYPEGFSLLCSPRKDRSEVLSYATSRFTPVNTPQAIAALRPFSFTYRPQQGCVRMQIFGMYSTGLPTPPYFGLEIDTRTNTANYKHRARDTSGDFVNKRVSVTNQVAERIYEIY